MSDEPNIGCGDITVKDLLTYRRVVEHLERCRPCFLGQHDVPHVTEEGRYGMTKEATQQVRGQLLSRETMEDKQTVKRECRRALRQFDAGDPSLAIKIIEQELRTIVPPGSADYSRLSASLDLMRKHVPPTA